MSSPFQADLYATYEAIASEAEFLRDSYGSESRELTITSADPRMAAISTILAGLNVELVDSFAVISRYEPAWIDTENFVQPAQEDITILFNRPDATKIYALTKYEDDSVSVHKTWVLDDEAQTDVLKKYLVAATTGVGVSEIADQLEQEEAAGLHTIDPEEFLVLTALSKILS